MSRTEVGGPFDLPQNWRWVSLGTLNERPSASLMPSRNPSERFELYSVPIFPEGYPEILTGAEIGSGKQIVEPGDVLLCKINPRINRVWITGNHTPHQKIASSEWIVIRPPATNAFGPYLVHVLRSPYFRELIQSNVSGVGGSLTRARPRDVADYPVPLPPLPEQKRIVAKLDSMLGKIKQARELVQEARDTFANRRASILAMAFRGELTAKWREDNPDVEPAEKLLERIREEREKAYSEAANRAKAKGDRKPQKYYESVIPSNFQRLPVDLPNTWTQIPLGFLAHVTKLAGFEHTKYFDPKPKGEVAVIRAQNVKSEGFNAENLVYIPKKVSLALERSRIYGNEILMVFIGAGTGDSCLAPESGAWHLATNVAKITAPEIDKHFLCYYLQSPLGLKSIMSYVKATAQPSLSMETIRKGMVLLPPLTEQRAIVEIVESLFVKTRMAEEIVELNGSLDSLEQSILARAFRGELGTGNVSEEPAS